MAFGRGLSGEGHMYAEINGPFGQKFTDPLDRNSRTRKYPRRDSIESRHHAIDGMEGIAFCKYEFQTGWGGIRVEYENISDGV